MRALSAQSQFVTTERESPFYSSHNTCMHYYVGGLAVNNRIFGSSRIRVTSVAYILGVLTLAIYGFIAYSVIPIANVIAVTIALYAAGSIVVGGESKKLPTVFTISVLFTIVSDLCFAFLQPFIAFCISLFVLLVATKYFLIKDHDSGWFGALCAVLLGLVFLLPIMIALTIAQFFLL